MTDQSSPEGPLIFLLAGEPSGDQLGARLMRALKDKTGGRICFAGIGGPLMEEQGFESLYPISDFAVMGLLEVVPHVAKIYRRVQATVTAVKAARPAVVVTIDSPSFTLQVSKRLQGLGIPLVHYVAPSVWAWKAWRAKKIAAYLDRLLTLLPFEPPYFEVHGLKSVFVGHPVVEIADEFRGDRGDFRQEMRDRLKLREDDRLICMLPGSRRGEVSRLLPVFRETAERLGQDLPGLQVVVPTVSTVRDFLQEHLEDWPVPVTLLRAPSDKLKAFCACDVAVAASGTVAVELAVSGVPTVVTYKVNPLTARLAKRILKLRYVSLPNILLDKEVQPELLQWDCTPDNISKEVLRLLQDGQARYDQLSAYEEVEKMLRPGKVLPSQAAADEILALI